MIKLKVPEKLKSRKFWLALVAAFVAFANSYWDLGFSQDQVWAVIIPLLAYIGIEGLVDITKEG